MSNRQPPTFFVDHKRGEVNELRILLRSPAVLRDPQRKLEVIKKVIAYMTLGVDVSKVFSEMIMAANTKDLVLKKMVYHYLCNYAKVKADLALMAINTLQKDCRDEDPMVRGLALRSLSSLNVPNIVEYVLAPIRERLQDPSAYVRKTAAVGCAKLFRISPSSVKESDLVDVLYNMLRDNDCTVVANVIQALNEVLASEGQMAINQNIVLHLLNNIRKFNEWGQCTVLELISKYTPSSQDEMFDIMNLLEDRLKHSNSAVVLGTTKVFLNFTENLPDIHAQVMERLKPPLLTLMNGQSFEVSFAVLSHIHLLVQKCRQSLHINVFSDSFKHFFCRYNEPACVKSLKLEVLTLVADENNASNIQSELSEYVSDVNPDIAKKAIQGIAKIAVMVPEAVDDAIEHLLGFLELQTDYVSSETCIGIKDLLRKYPERYEDVIPSLQTCLKTIDDEEGKTAVIWMIGEYGDTIAEAPYILEPLVDSFEEEPSNMVRMELLSATMKLFFKRPPEVHKMLGRLLKLSIDDSSKVDVRDRALLYYRLLSSDVHEAARVVNCPKVIVDKFAENLDLAKIQSLFKEFNSLSVVYNMTSERFVNAKKDDDEEEDEDDDALDNNDNLNNNHAGADEIKAPNVVSNQNYNDNTKNINNNTYTPAVTQNSAQAVETDLLGILDDNFSQPSASSSSQSPLSLSNIMGLPTQQQAPAQPQAPTLTLQEKAQVKPQVFQSKWGSISNADRVASLAFSLQHPERAKKTTAGAGLESMLSGASVYTMASGQVGQDLKFYFYARPSDNTEAVFLVECIVSLASGQVTATVKADSVADWQFHSFKQIFQQAAQSMDA